MEKTLGSIQVRNAPLGLCYLMSPDKHWINDISLSHRILDSMAKWVSPYNAPQLDLISLDQARQALLSFSEQSYSASRGHELVSIGPYTLLHPPEHWNSDGKPKYHHAQTQQSWVAFRRPMSLEMIERTTILLKVDQVCLWDGRFYISVKKPLLLMQGGIMATPHYSPVARTPLRKLTFVVRAFTKEDLDYISFYLRSSPPSPRRRSMLQVLDQFTKFWSVIPVQARYVLPVVCLRLPGDMHHVISLPSININLRPDLCEVLVSYGKESAWDNRMFERGFEAFDVNNEQDKRSRLYASRITY